MCSFLRFEGSKKAKFLTCRMASKHTVKESNPVSILNNTYVIKIYETQNCGTIR